MPEDTKPVSPRKHTLEELLVERLAATYWRACRAARHEAQSILKRRQHANSPLSQISRDLEGIEPPPDDELPAGTDFQHLLRYEGMIDRTLHRLTLQFSRLRNTRVFLTHAPDPNPLGSQQTPAGHDTHKTSEQTQLAIDNTDQSAATDPPGERG